MLSRRLLILLAILALPAGVAARGYLKFGTPVGNQVVGLQWSHFPIAYAITSRDIAGVTAAQLQTQAATAFGTWGGIDHVSLPTQFLGFTPKDPTDDDGLATIGFRSRPDLDRT